jgi:hypothetical protein
MLYEKSGSSRTVSPIKGIAISGKAAAGKDAVGEELVRHLSASGIQARIVKLAKPIYDEAITLYRMNPSNKDRKLLQEIGDSHTSIDPTYYPRLLIEELREKHNSLHAFDPVFPVVTDLRKVVEAEYLQQVGFALVRLDVLSSVQTDRIMRLYGESGFGRLLHWTETDLDHYAKWDIKIPNNGNMTPSAVAWVIAASLGYDID